MRIKDRISKKVNPKKVTSHKIKKELGEEVKEDKKLVVSRAKRIKELWKTKETIQLKTDAIAVLWNKRGSENEFFEAFDKITKEGYRMVLSEEVKAVDVGPIGMSIGTYYYFQHREFIN